MTLPKKQTRRTAAQPAASKPGMTLPASAPVSFAQNSKGNSKSKRGNPDAIAPYKFKPGESGNPGGRPKRKILTDAYKDALELPAKVLVGLDVIAALGLEEDCTMAEVIARKQVFASIEDVKSAAHIADRTEGKPLQKVEVSRGEFDNRTDEEIKHFVEHGCYPDGSR